MHFPIPSEEQVSILDSEITEDDIREAMSSLVAGKASRPDGLPLEVYCRYLDIIAPVLQQVYSRTFQEGKLSPSMYSAAVVPNQI